MSTLHQMPAHSRVWVYASNKLLSSTVCDQIKLEAKQFATEWISHQNPVKAEADVLYNTFIVFMVDETMNGVGGCSIDKSFQFVKQLEKKLDLNFFDRLKVQLLWEDGSVSSFNKVELQSLYNEGKIIDTTKSFNNTISNKQEFDSKWIIPLKDLWIYNLLKPSQISI